MSFPIQQLKSRLKTICNSDYRWSQLTEPMSSFKKSAVLIPISYNPRHINDDNRHITVWLTKRSENMRHDKGQVSFPGGMKDENDPDAIAVALREAEEEIGLNHSLVEILGELPPVNNMRGVIITPILAIVDPSFVPHSNQEVEFAFRLPLNRFLSSTGHAAQKFDGFITPFFLHNFYDVLMPENFFKSHQETDVDSGLSDEESRDTDFNLLSSKNNQDFNKNAIYSQNNLNNKSGGNGKEFQSSENKIFENEKNIPQNKSLNHNFSNKENEFSVNTFGLTASLCIEVASGVFLKKPEFRRFADDGEEEESIPSKPWLHRVNWIKKVVENYSSRSKL